MIEKYNGLDCVSSLTIAKEFNKRHDIVLRDIEKEILNFPSLYSDSGMPSILRQSYDNHASEMPSILAPSMEALRPEQMFFETTYSDKYGRSQKCYMLTEYGFYWITFSYNTAFAKKIKYMFFVEFFKLRQLSEAVKELSKAKVNELQDKVSTLIARAEELEKNSTWIKLSDYFSQKGINLTLPEKKKLGWDTTVYCNNNNIPVIPLSGPYGKTNTYPIHVLEMKLREYLLTHKNTLSLFN